MSVKIKVLFFENVMGGTASAITPLKFPTDKSMERCTLDVENEISGKGGIPFVLSLHIEIEGRMWREWPEEVVEWDECEIQRKLKGRVEEQGGVLHL